ncbi:hypothetical protein HSX11_02195 [Oxalobacteraceae bacterium]|nr:hypothetical protein [Oxalobacteraceae bacterium]
MAAYLVQVDLSGGGATPGYTVSSQGKADPEKNTMPSVFALGDSLQFSIIVGDDGARGGLRELKQLTLYVRPASNRVPAKSPFQPENDVHSFTILDAGNGQQERSGNTYQCAKRLSICVGGGSWQCTLLGLYVNRVATLTPFLLDFRCRVS